MRRAWAEAYLEADPDAFLVSALRREDPEHGDSWTLAHLWVALDRHQRRLGRIKETERLHEVAPKLRSRIKRYPSLDKALGRLALKAPTTSTQGQTRDEVLEEMIPGVAYVVESELKPGQNLAGKVANQIRREGLERPDEPDLVSTPGSDVLLRETESLARSLEEREEVAFIDRERLTEIVRSAGLTRQQRESWVFGVLLGNQTAAQMLGRPPNQIAQEKMQAYKKIRRVI
jgi:hypothetical protein